MFKKNIVTSAFRDIKSPDVNEALEKNVDPDDINERNSKPSTFARTQTHAQIRTVTSEQKLRTLTCIINLNLLISF